MYPNYGVARIWNARPATPARAAGLYLVERPAEMGLGVRHQAILDTANVLQLQPNRLNRLSVLVELTLESGYAATEIFELAAGWRVVALAPDPLGARRRLELALANWRKYDVGFNNCEHFARDVVLGERKSPQISGWTWGAIGVVALAVAAHK